MTKRHHWTLILSTLLGAAILLSAATASAQDAEEPGGWFFNGELSTVSTSGNSQGFTLGATAELGHEWVKSVLRFKGGGILQESSIRKLYATGTVSDPVRQDSTVTERTAEAYFLRGRYDYNVSERFYLFGGADWMRNKFSGIDSRLLFAAGAGNTWKDNDKLRFKTDYSVTYTFEEDVVENPFTKSNFPGLRLSYDFFAQLSNAVSFESWLWADWNLDNTDDIRLDFNNALPITISSHLMFKPGLKLLWRNDPALTTVPLVDAGGVPTGDTVPVPLDKLDSFFTISLVFKY